MRILPLWIGSSYKMIFGSITKTLIRGLLGPLPLETAAEGVLGGTLLYTRLWESFAGILREMQYAWKGVLGSYGLNDYRCDVEESLLYVTIL